jgi:HEAT repeat protein
MTGPLALRLAFLLRAQPELAVRAAQAFRQAADRQELFGLARALAACSRHEAVRDIMLAQIRQGDPDHRELAAFAFVGTADPATLQVLVRVYASDPLEDVRVSVGFVLASTTRNLDEVTRKKVRLVSRQLAASATSPLLRAQAVELLGACGLEPEDRSFLLTLLRGEPGSEVRLQALAVLSVDLEIPGEVRAELRSLTGTQRQ